LNNEVSIRDVIESDLPIFFEQQRQPEANRMAAFPARAREVGYWIGMDYWGKGIASAKKPETRTKRIEESVRLAGENIRANHWQT